MISLSMMVVTHGKHLRLDDFVWLRLDDYSCK